ncbi:variant erythrocyte surface antigen-1 family protein [Babesia caballi]|uniref:Variant erythrocyte surface antigen-1 family protein n=1 Tax=Babesia caballi TaxID=5871 RepID=A0AAV4LNC4_BABCB|nr:variant erythrocyte surface antigen-1 family protein [Babesia caballi]
MIKLKNDQTIKGLAEELIKLLDSDPKNVAEGVLKVMGGSLTKVVGGLDSLKSQQTYVRSPVAFIQTFKSKTELVRDYGSAVDDGRIGELIDLLQKDATKGTGGPISALADKLKSFIGYQANGKPDGTGIIKNSNSYQSAYDGKKWNEVGDQKVCAKIFLGVAPLIFYLLPFLYWKCKLPAIDDGGWANKKLNEEHPKSFMEKMGFSDKQLDDSKHGSKVATLTGSTCFKEIETAYYQAKKEAQKNPPTKTLSPEPYYATVIRKLEELKNSSIHPETSPLSRCYLIAFTFFTPNETYEVQSSSPATPSFIGYSGTAALAGGAYGFNLGGLGTFMSALLA